ncbi:ACP phosphodiesterase [Alteromonas sp. ASW11-36]|uniref:ACP phosphodiesterase n=1 Tax=Alteromonas arenosi TaxID=3055817 RepID=A0ABT7T0V7_9ALTE|nr:ACP phosphodiesterase [Alteromonas sp. ASW11-36]MDM7861874.1 ACP phosphodiesterase [Alteromonas sp. ASW11-36]
MGTANLNYLAHIQLAHHSGTSKLGNFLGDFVKGYDLSRFPVSIQQGIELHRAIDSYTDNHPITADLRRLFPPELRRMAGVIIDVYFDHLLCRQWHCYNTNVQSEVLDGFYAELAATQLSVGPRFDRVKQGLIEYRWLTDYAEIEGVIRAYQHIEQRLKGKIRFADGAATLITHRHKEMHHAFEQLYPQLQQFVVKKTTNC